jgi:hypothetical protein|uniref:Uncharacterized protein n=1 Tax=Zea mays TaxID=4577 RepID=C0HHZ4_MAIZE|nr:unknown [Zea mays]
MELLDGQVRPPHAPEQAFRQRLGHRRRLLMLLRWRWRQSRDRGGRARQGRRRESAHEELGGEVDADVGPWRDQRREAAAEVQQPAVRVHGGERRRQGRRGEGQPTVRAQQRAVERARRRRRRRRRGCGRRAGALAAAGGRGLARAAADGDVAERSPARPVAAAGPAEVARLGQVVVVVVAELGVGGLAARARQALRLPPASRAGTAAAAAGGHGSRQRPPVRHLAHLRGSGRANHPSSPLLSRLLLAKVARTYQLLVDTVASATVQGVGWRQGWTDRRGNL